MSTALPRPQTAPRVAEDDGRAACCPGRPLVSAPDKATCARHGYGPAALDDQRILRCAREVGGGRRCGWAIGEWIPAVGVLYPLTDAQLVAEGRLRDGARR